MKAVDRNTNKLKHLICRLQDWLLLDEGFIPLIRRLTALCFIPSMLMVWAGSQGAGGPYNVPTWRFGQFFLAVPLPPDWLNLFLFPLAICFSLLLVLGFSSRYLVCFPTLFLIYYACVDRVALQCHYVVMLLIYMVALSLHLPGKSYSRRIIQLGVASCYGFAVLERFATPDYLSGKSFYYTVGTGWAVNDVFKPLYLALGELNWLWMPFANIVLLLEIFLAFAFFFSRTRKIAIACGVMLHLSIAATMNEFLIIYSLLMIIGYLAFIERKPTSSSCDIESLSSSRLPVMNTLLASIFILLMFLIPARVFFWTERPIGTMVMTDRDPWSFGMFVLRMNVPEIEARYRDVNGGWQTCPLEGRMRFAAADSDLIQLTRYILKSYPNACRVEVISKIPLNDWYQIKNARCERKENGAIGDTYIDASICKAGL